jgi:anti-sigma factor RsiW
MNCERYQEDASQFMDGLLEASEQARLFAHLSSCSDCRSFLASSVRVREVIGKDPATLPAGVDELFFEQLSSRPAVHAAGHRRQQAFWRREVLLSYPLAAAALLLVVLASVLFSLLFMRSGGRTNGLETVLGGSRTDGHRTVVVVYQLPEEQVVSVPPSSIFEVKAKVVAD